MTVFLDTVGLLAVWDESDQWHRAAQACFSELLGCRANLVTSSFVLLECGNAAARRPYRSAVSRLRKQMEPGHHLTELLLVISDPTDDAYHDVDLLLRPDNPVAGVGQVSNFPDVSFQDRYTQESALGRWLLGPLCVRGDQRGV